MKKKFKDGLKVRGFFRLNIVNPDGKVAGDSGWVENQIVNTGYQNFLQYVLVGNAASKTVSHAALGTGTGAATADATLVGQLTETGCKVAITTGTAGSKTVSWTFTVPSGTLAAASTINNVALYYYTAQAQPNTSGTMMCGTSYATSQLATNQAVNGTYQISFA